MYAIFTYIILNINQLYVNIPYMDPIGQILLSDLSCRNPSIKGGLNFILIRAYDVYIYIVHPLLDDVIWDQTFSSLEIQSPSENGNGT